MKTKDAIKLFIILAIIVSILEAQVLFLGYEERRQNDILAQELKIQKEEYACVNSLNELNLLEQRSSDVVKKSEQLQIIENEIVAYNTKYKSK